MEFDSIPPMTFGGILSPLQFSKIFSCPPLIIIKTNKFNHNLGNDLTNVLPDFLLNILSNAYSLTLTFIVTFPTTFVPFSFNHNQRLYDSGIISPPRVLCSGALESCLFNFFMSFSFSIDEALTFKIENKFINREPEHGNI